MTPLKSNFVPSFIALLVSACGAKSNLGSYTDLQSQASSIQNVLASGLSAGNLPQLVPSASNQSPGIDQSSVSQGANSQFISPASQISLAQASQDFGYLNNCYQKINQDGLGYFQMGLSADAVFKGAGQALVNCYNYSIQLQQNRAQTDLYTQNYIIQQYAAHLAAQRQQGGVAFTIPRPPGARQ